jgi:asparagine synthase (glutamine-hydrolysing)
MWAFVIYDIARKQVLLSRDRFGEKPLYYYFKDEKLIFASEIKAILAHPVRRQGNTREICDYLYLGVANHRLDSFFEDIQMLAPAHNAIFDLRTKQMSFDKYYEPKYGNRRVSPDEFLGVLRKSVQRRLVSDVPISVSLSSGIDSPSVAALTTEFTKGPIKAFSTATEGAIGDETTLLSHFLKKYPQYELERTYLSEDSFCQHYREIIFHMDEPFVRQSAYVRWMIANLTHKYKRKVLLNGEGADEVLGGYIPFAPYFLLGLARRFMFVRFAREFVSILFHPERQQIFDSSRGILLLKRSVRKQQEEDIKKHKQKFQIKINQAQVHGPPPRIKNVKEYLYELLSVSSLPRLLNCNDKMSMANSVESRAPYLDHEFVDLAFSMDERDFIVNGRRKYPLRQAMRGRVPDEILFRKDKDAFQAPIFEFLRNESIQQRIRQIFRDARTANIFNPRAYLNEYEQFLSRHGAYRLFLLHGLFLEEWARMFDVNL